MLPSLKCQLILLKLEQKHYNFNRPTKMCWKGPPVRASSVSWLTLLSKLTSQSVMINLAFQRKSACCYLADKCMFEPPATCVLNQMFNNAWVCISNSSPKTRRTSIRAGVMTSLLAWTVWNNSVSTPSPQRCRQRRDSETWRFSSLEISHIVPQGSHSVVYEYLFYHSGINESSSGSVAAPYALLFTPYHHNLTCVGANFA